MQAGATEGADVWQPPDACPTDGWFYPPTLVTGVGPASELAQVEIFGPVLVSMSFRTPGEAVALANNTRYGLAASVWTQDIDQALEVARGIQAGTVWINSTNLFDASSGFGGYRESGYGREGGREGLFEYLQRRQPDVPSRASPLRVERGPGGLEKTPLGAMRPERSAASLTIDRTPKLFIGGKQARPDSGYSRLVYSPTGTLLGEVPVGNRKDIRNAVEAARAALTTWASNTGYNRAQILYYLAENLSVRSAEFAERIAQQTGHSGHSEVEQASARAQPCASLDCELKAQHSSGAGGARPVTAGSECTSRRGEPA